MSEEKGREELKSSPGSGKSNVISFLAAKIRLFRKRDGEGPKEEEINAPDAQSDDARWEDL